MTGRLALGEWHLILLGILGLRAVGKGHLVSFLLERLGPTAILWALEALILHMMLLGHHILLLTMWHRHVMLLRVVVAIVLVALVIAPVVVPLVVVVLVGAGRYWPDSCW